MHDTLSRLFDVALVCVAIAFGLGAVRAFSRQNGRLRPYPSEILAGLVTDFFDTLGIGSFASTTAIFKLRRMVPDELIPGTLNVGKTPSAITEALIFVGAIQVDPVLLTSLIASATGGAWVGADIVARLSKRSIQLLMGVALLFAGIIFAGVNLKWLPGGGTALTLAGWQFGVALAVNFGLGILMSAGIGLYAPCMITLALLGMHPLAAFPIMAGACAMVQPVAGLRFFQTGAFAWGTSVGLAMGGVAGVLTAAYVVKSLPLMALRWLVVVVVAYAAFAMLRSAAQSQE
jgi:uncharacterized membrane protein YfcA